MFYELPPLPYAPDALEPYVDARTLEIHHGKHHAAYVDKLNKALEGRANLDGKIIEELIVAANLIPEEIRTAVLQNGGQHANHSLFWECMRPRGGGEPEGALLKAIKRDFGSLAAFKEKFSNAAATHFGSGWAWLYFEEDRLKVGSTSNHESPLMDVCKLRGVPILVLDVWEHAYYLKYQNCRLDFIAAFWNVVDWDSASERYESALM